MDGIYTVHMAPTPSTQTGPKDKTAEWARAAAGYFDHDRRTIYTRPELEEVLHEHHWEWRVPESLVLSRFVDTMVHRGCLRRIAIRRVSRDKKRARGRRGSTRPEGTDEGSTVVRYVSREPTIHQVALSLKAGAYLSHASAMFLHGLTTRAPETVYVNKEQTPKPSLGSLTQMGLDAAFKRPARVSRDAYSYGTATFLLLSGKHTRRLGVVDVPDAQGDAIPITGLERTLVDAVVRPVYAGGALEVLHAYRAARGRLSVEVMLQILKKLDYLYPYHQAIGFYMQRAEYPHDEVERFRALGLTFDFYLEHRMAQAQYDRSWRLYHPPGL